MEQQGGVRPRLPVVGTVDRTTDREAPKGVGIRGEGQVPDGAVGARRERALIEAARRGGQPDVAVVRRDPRGGRVDEPRSEGQRGRVGRDRRRLVLGARRVPAGASRRASTSAQRRPGDGRMRGVSSVERTAFGSGTRRRRNVTERPSDTDGYRPAGVTLRRLEHVEFHAHLARGRTDPETVGRPQKTACDSPATLGNAGTAEGPGIAPGPFVTAKLNLLSVLLDDRQRVRRGVHVADGAGCVVAHRDDVRGSRGREAKLRVQRGAADSG